MALSSTLKISADCTLTKTADFESASSRIAKALSIALTDGTGVGQADVIFKDTRTLSASASEDLDVATGGGLTDVYGTAIAMARIKAIIVLAVSGNTNNVNVARPASNGVPWALAAGDGFGVRPGGGFAWVCSDATGVAVTAGTGDLINFANSAGGTSVSYDVILIGASA